VDYADFVDAVRAASEALGVAVLGYCLMPDHFHLVVLPKKDGDLSRFMLRVVAAHVRHYRLRYRAETGDKLYASRFRSFPVQKDSHLLDVLRFVESNPARSNAVKRANQWEWSSLATRGTRDTFIDSSLVKIPAGWERSVTQPMDGELETLRTCLFRGRPYGDATWTRRTADRLGLGSSLHPIGRPRKMVAKKK
jgi:putative transposase